MDNLNKSILDYVNSGHYFEDAKTWYVNRYVFPSTERSYLLILLSFFLLITATLGFFYNMIDPAPPETTYISNSQDVAKSYSMILPVGDQLQEPQISLVKYVVSNYVINRERYLYDKVLNQINFVKNTTIAEDYIKYANMQSINNPDSPIIIYQDEHVKTIKITKINLLDSKDHINKAVVYFDSYLKNLVSNHVVEENLLVKVEFQIDNIETALAGENKQFNFLVTKYELQKLNK